jgi:hypothetical protein
VIYQDISSLLESGGVGTLGSNLFWGMLPDAPDLATAVFEYAGEPPTYVKSRKVEWEHPRLQVITRGKTYIEAMQKAEDVYAALHGVRGQTINGKLYDSIRARQRPFADPSGKDDRGRFRVFCNYAVKKQP